MPDKKLTDKEIKKALEDLKKCNNNEIDCGNCALSKFYPRCPEEIGELALDLINRQDKEIERLKPFEDKIAEYNSHIRVEDMLVFASSLGEWLEFCDNLKADAYKECIEKVKEKYQIFENQAYATNPYALHNFLDNLLKEFKEKNNDDSRNAR